ncbi:cytochrome c-type biogenesis protein CcmH [Spongiibacter taiwanensis]|uniref:cytochrome c-type biogenesis protein n=1 Tax=Spongiibacter taiwanensis TaxID=1748242 RepID=UPI0020360D62|nr:cytochrome c-type biogenesis protein [Spongiibacter taiwanensis]USA43173.1 cytochrome c-type biogenesis protein CcmH [Spongiibacter taiwanensis]
MAGFPKYQRLARALAATLLAVWACTSLAVIETYSFDNDLQRQRYQHFIEELRCPKCQNQNLSGSDAAIAQDLRREVHRMIMAGKSDTEITQYMVQRYGEFVLYRPRVNAATAVLWYGPFVLVLIGGVVWWRLSARRNAPVAKETDLTPAEQARLAALMEESDSDHGGAQG